MTEFHALSETNTAQRKWSLCGINRQQKPREKNTGQSKSNDIKCKINLGN
jgi:hypothetical protein